MAEKEFRYIMSKVYAFMTDFALQLALRSLVDEAKMRTRFYFFNQKK